MNTLTDRQVSAFHTRFCPYAERLYRSALVVTGNPKSAARLQVDIYLKAFVEYLHTTRPASFENWLAEIASECIADYGLYQSDTVLPPNVVYELERMTLNHLVDCGKNNPGIRQSSRI